MFICRSCPEEEMSHMVQMWRMSKSYVSGVTAAACSAALCATSYSDVPISDPSELQRLPDTRFPVMFWSFASFSFWLRANLESLTRKKFYTFAVPCPKPWVLISARCAIFCCLLIWIFLFSMQNMSTHCLGAACQAGEMTPRATSTPSKVLFWDQASAQVIQQSFILLT